MTTAERKLKEANKSLKETIGLLTEVINPTVEGSDEFDNDEIFDIHNYIYKLIKLKNKLEDLV